MRLGQESASCGENVRRPITHNQAASAKPWGQSPGNLLSAHESCASVVASQRMIRLIQFHRGTFAVVGAAIAGAFFPKHLDAEIPHFCVGVRKRL